METRKKSWIVLVVAFLLVMFVSENGSSEKITEEQRKKMHEEVISGCTIFASDEEFAKWFVGENKGLTDNVVLFSYCNYMGQHLPARYGDIKTAFPQKEWGIKTGRAYSYELFCQTTERLLQNIPINDLRKMVYIVLQEGENRQLPKSPSEKGRKFLVSWHLGWAVDTFKKLKKADILFLLKVDREYYRDSRTKKERYKKLYGALMTGDSREALTLIQSVPDKVLQDIKEGCEIVKENYEIEFK